MKFTFYILLAVLTLASCTKAPDPTLALPLKNDALLQCYKDTDCKGNRVCDDGKCMNPSAASSQTLSSQFHTILVSENWDRPSELKALIHFPVKVKEVVYLSGKCDSKCTQFIVRDYVSLRPVLAALHNSWTAEPEPGYEEYAPSPFGAMSKNSYGVWFMGDCPHVDEVVLGSSNKIESINVDTAGLAENESMKNSVAGTCK